MVAASPASWNLPREITPRQPSSRHWQLSARAVHVRAPPPTSKPRRKALVFKAALAGELFLPHRLLRLRRLDTQHRAVGTGTSSRREAIVGALQDLPRMMRRTRDAEAQLNLPPGFRFHPTDEELVVAYLCRKVAHQCLPVPIIAEVDLYKYDPWQLPEKALFGSREWYFFTPRDRKYPNGSRPNRAAGSGYWKATGADKPVTLAGGTRPLGIKKALVFYAGKAPKGVKTDWIMHEYRLADVNRAAANKKGAAAAGSLRLDDWVLCRLYNKKNNWQRTTGSAGETMDSFEAAGDTGSESLRTPESDVDNGDCGEEQGGFRRPFSFAPQAPHTAAQAPSGGAMVGSVKEENDWFMDLHLDDLQSSLVAAGVAPLDLSYQDSYLLGMASPQLKPGQNNLPPF